MRQIYHTSLSYLRQFFNLCFLRGEKLYFEYYVLHLIMLHSEVFSSLKITSHFPQQLFSTTFHSSISQIPLYVSHFIPVSLDQQTFNIFSDIISPFSFRFCDSTLEFSTLTFPSTLCFYSKDLVTTPSLSLPAKK